jgi:hypothetical protein
MSARLIDVAAEPTLGARMGRATTEKAERCREMSRDETPDRSQDGRVLPGHRTTPDLPFKAVARVQIPLGPPVKMGSTRRTVVDLP